MQSMKHIFLLKVFGDDLNHAQKGFVSPQGISRLQKRIYEASVCSLSGIIMLPSKISWWAALSLLTRPAPITKVTIKEKNIKKKINTLFLTTAAQIRGSNHAIHKLSV
jgi:hypothetical protein